MISVRQFAVIGAGVVSALVVAAGPIAASADSGHRVPVRLNPHGGHTNPSYLAEVSHAFAVVQRSDDGVTFIVHDKDIAGGTGYQVAVFNNPSACSTAPDPGEMDPEGDKVGMCDPGVDIHFPANPTGFAFLGAGTVDRDDQGNFSITVPASKAFTNPQGAEVYLILGHNDKIVIASPGKSLSDRT